MGFRRPFFFRLFGRKRFFIIKTATVSAAARTICGEPQDGSFEMIRYGDICRELKI